MMVKGVPLDKEGNIDVGLVFGVALENVGDDLFNYKSSRSKSFLNQFYKV